MGKFNKDHFRDTIHEAYQEIQRDPMNTKGQPEIPKDAQAYAACMEEIKTRLAVVQKVGKREITTGKGTELIDLELAYLQVRKVIELL